MKSEQEMKVDFLVGIECCLLGEVEGVGGGGTCPTLVGRKEEVGNFLLYEVEGCLLGEDGGRSIGAAGTVR